MSSYAFKDSQRTKIIYANSCTINDKNVRFYCENPNCGAHLYVRAVKSTLITHFYAIKEHPHVGWCSKEHSDFKPTFYDEKYFIFEDTINKILSYPEKQINNPLLNKHAIGNGKIRALSKTAQIYMMCKYYRPDDSYHDIKIWRMLFDVRSNPFLT